MNPEKQLEEIFDIRERLTKGMASETDLKELFDLVLALLEKLSNDFDQKMQENKGETDNVYREVYAELSDIKQGIKDKLRQLKENVGVGIKAVATQVIDKVKELEAKIPSPTDLSSIEGRLARKIITVNTFSGAPSEAQENDMLVVENTGDIYIYK